MRKIVPALLLCLAAFAQEQAPPEPAPAPQKSEFQARVEKNCAEITAKLEEFLGKKFEAPVPVRMMTKEEIVEFARESQRQQTPRGMFEVYQALAERLHLVEPGYDLVENSLKMLKQGVAGLYDPDENCFFVVKGTGSPGSGPFTITAAHELGHAYRDVDKDYWPRTLKLTDTDMDAAQAVRFLVEGDATLLGYLVGYAKLTKKAPDDFVPAMRAQAANSELMLQQAGANPMLSEFPLVLRETLIAAYTDGLAFAVAVYDQGGKEALAAAYDRPPRSTEQVLHPEKYLGAAVDEPTIFSGGDPTEALGEGWKRELRNTIGEFDIRIQFTDALTRKRAREVAAGWDGGAFWFCRKEGLPGFIGALTTWDSEKDAREFGGAWAEWAAGRDDGRRKIKVTEDGWSVVTKEGLVVVRVKGNDVLVADGVPEDRVEPVLAAMATATRAERTPDFNPLK